MGGGGVQFPEKKRYFNGLLVMQHYNKKECCNSNSLSSLHHWLVLMDHNQSYPNLPPHPTPSSHGKEAAECSDPSLSVGATPTSDWPKPLWDTHWTDSMAHTMGLLWDIVFHNTSCRFYNWGLSTGNWLAQGRYLLLLSCISIILLITLFSTICNP